MDKIAKKANIPANRYLKFWDLTRIDEKKLFDVDMLHPNDAGHDKMAELAYEMMSKDTELLKRAQNLAEGKD